MPKPLDGRIQLLVLAGVGLFVIALALSLQGNLSFQAPLQPAGNESILQNLGLAPEFAGLSQWFNSEPLTITGLRGKVVLVDFWAYSCLNCVHTLPYLKQWHEKYKDKGLVIVGIHSPEFDFEKQPENVKAALEKQGLAYPVALDNEHSTWDAFQNQGWPHHYLVDKDGVIRYHHLGEGGYEETEKAIQALLGETAALEKPMDAPSVDFTNIQTPEIYLGSEQFVPGTERLLGFQGNWKQNPDSMELLDDLGAVRLVFHAKSVNFVADAPAGARLKVVLDGKEKGTLEVKQAGLYEVAAADDYATHGLELGVSGKGFKLYTFTFG